MKLLLTLLFISHLNAAIIETIAGTGEPGYTGDNSPAKTAQLNQPFGIVVGPDDDIYFCDTNNHVIRRISSSTGVITSHVGNGKKGCSGDNPKNLTLNEPYELRFHSNGDLYWVERLNHVVRKLDAKSGKIMTVAGTGQAGFSGDNGPANAASMNQPHSIVFDQTQENLLICDILNHRIRSVSLATGKIETWCGTGKKDPTPDGAKVSDKVPLKGPRALDIAPNGDLWLALREGNAIYRIDAKTDKLEHMAGTGKQGFTGNGGPAKEATLAGPKGLAISPDGKLIYFADTESHTIRAIDLSKNPPTVELIAGTGQKGDGPDSPDPLACKMARLHGICTHPKTGDLYIGDSETHKVRVVRVAKK